MSKPQDSRIHKFTGGLASTARQQNPGAAEFRGSRRGSSSDSGDLGAIGVAVQMALLTRTRKVSVVLAGGMEGETATQDTVLGRDG